jgi:uncharacterized repeat protein (TIGR03803 family)
MKLRIFRLVAVTAFAFACYQQPAGALGGAASDPTESVVHSFTGGSDGDTPYGSLISDTSGALYGTSSGEGLGTGTVFRLTPPASAGGAWTESVLYTFCSPTSSCASGFNPQGGLIMDATGNLYGTTLQGGTYGQGTVFELTPPTTSGGTWTHKVLYNFTGGSDGAQPVDAAGLIFDASGALYGTTGGGGTAVGGNGNGTVFKLSPPSTVGRRLDRGRAVHLRWRKRRRQS